MHGVNDQKTLVKGLHDHGDQENHHIDSQRKSYNRTKGERQTLRSQETKPEACDHLDSSPNPKSHEERNKLSLGKNRRDHTIVYKRRGPHVLVWNETKNKEHHTIAQIKRNPNVLV